MSVFEHLLPVDAACGAGRSRHTLTKQRPWRCLLPLLLAACAAAQRRTVTLARDVQLVIIASELQPALWEAQQATFMGVFSPALRMTESNSSCTLCTNSRRKRIRHQELFLSDRRDGMPFLDKPVGWWCAQSRNLQALRLALESASQSRLWTVAVDDDTYVNVVALKQLLEAHDAELPIALGSRYGGGAGYIISAGAARRLLAPTMQRRMVWNGSTWLRVGKEQRNTVLDACIEAQLGGAMCASHADWAVGRCLHAARVPLVEHRTTMQQDCDYPRKRKTCDAAMVTCHHVGAEEMRSLHALCYPQRARAAAAG